MISVVHLTDDPNLGGVNRTLEELLQRLDPRFVQRRQHVSPASGLPPALLARILVVHFTVSWRKLAWLQGLRARNPRAAVILVEHSYTRAFEALHVRKRVRFRAMLRLAYGMADRVVSVSEAQGAWMREVAGLGDKKLIVINPHTDLAALRTIPLRQRNAGPLGLCAYGRYAPQKGFDVLIEAMSMLSPDVATLRLAGLGPDEAALRAQAKSLPQVSIEGQVSGPKSLLAAADAAVIPSRFEAFGNVGLEARAAARPIIVSAVDGLVEQALPVPELTVPPQNAGKLAAAISWLAHQNLTPLSTMARASAAGAEAHTIGKWNALFSDMC